MVSLPATNTPSRDPGIAPGLSGSLQTLLSTADLGQVALCVVFTSVSARSISLLIACEPRNSTRMTQRPYNRAEPLPSPPAYCSGFRCAVNGEAAVSQPYGPPRLDPGRAARRLIASFRSASVCLQAADRVVINRTSDLILWLSGSVKAV
ncbi:hypothetical protein Aduo_007195 [Ancylostoma duodenale]